MDFCCQGFTWVPLEGGGLSLVDTFLPFLSKSNLDDEAVCMRLDAKMGIQAFCKS